MMTNLDIAKALFENISSEGEVSTTDALALVDDNVIWEVCNGPNEKYLPFSGTFHGKVGVENWIAELNEHVEMEQIDRNYIEAEKGHVFCYGDARMRVRGRLTTFFFIEWVIIENGKVVKYKEVIDTARIIHCMKNYDRFEQD
ncbi:nuclear transport factor 2 family protein [Paraferrimonas sp. SM1919]|uniref:nuclear transport factor 2 family protein n=1 Tax=Paraferrimonas sp. SM1919 TaxID=2662263 RepID=UPI0013D1C09D|nr:hypothetical protein [Paraferrimonas sp. SM1919]